MSRSAHSHVPDDTPKADDRSTTKATTIRLTRAMPIRPSHHFRARGKTKEYRGNEYPLYWLTEEGVITALLEDASPIDLLTRTKEVYPNNQMLQYSLEMAPSINRDIFRIFLTALRSKGTLEPVDLGTIFFTQMESDATLEKLVKALETMRKYPNEYKHFKEQISRIQQNFSKLAKII